MKKIIAIVLIVLMAGATLSACNYDVIDSKYNFGAAQIKLPDGTVVAGEVESWRDFEDGDQLQITINGVTYLTHATNVVLIG